MSNSNIKTAIMEMLMARIHSDNTGDPYRRICFLYWQGQAVNL